MPSPSARMQPVVYIVTLVVLILAVFTLLYECILAPLLDRLRTPRRLGRGDVVQDPRVVPVAVAPMRPRRDPNPGLRQRRVVNAPSEAVEDAAQERDWQAFDYRSDRQRLMDEQQLEYERSLAEDQEKERKAEAERRAKEEERRQREEEERKRAEETAAEAVRRKQREEALPAEAEAGPDAATLVFKLADGQKVTRRFQKTEPAQHLLDFLELKCNVPGQLTLTCHMPKQTITSEHGTSTLVALGLHPQAVLFVRGAV